MGERCVFMCGLMLVWRPEVDLNGAQVPEVSIAYFL